MSTSTAEPAAPAGPGSGAGRGAAPGRALGAVLCAVLGIGCLGGAALGAWAEQHAAHRPPSAEAAYRRAGSLWHTAPVDTLFPPVLAAPDTGPGGADRTWTRVALAPDSECGPALTPDWQAALAPTGCTRVLRATYSDATRSSLVAVGLVFTPADAPAMAALDGRLTAPPAYGFGDGRRAAWTAAVLPDAPVVVYTVSAFADGRTVPAPVPAADAVRKDATGAVAQAGLGHGAKAVGERLERTVRELAAAPSAEPGGGGR